MDLLTNLDHKTLPPDWMFMRSESKNPIPSPFQFFPKQTSLGLNLWIAFLLMLFPILLFFLVKGGYGSWMGFTFVLVLFGLPAFYFILESAKDLMTHQKIKQGRYHPIL